MSAIQCAERLRSAGPAESCATAASRNVAKRSTGGRVADTRPSTPGRTLVNMILTVMVAWAVLAVLTAAFVAAVARGGLREEQARDRFRAETPQSEASRT